MPPFSVPPPVGQAITAAAWLGWPLWNSVTGVATCAGNSTGASGALLATRGFNAPKVAATAFTVASASMSPNTSTSIGPVASSGSQNLRKLSGVVSRIVASGGTPQRGSPLWSSRSRSRFRTASGEAERPA